MAGNGEVGIDFKRPERCFGVETLGYSRAKGVAVTPPAQKTVRAGTVPEVSPCR